MRKKNTEETGDKWAGDGEGDASEEGRPSIFIPNPLPAVYRGMMYGHRSPHVPPMYACI